MILAHCKHCGAIFRSQSIAVENSTGVTLTGNEETCPNCGGMANTAEGIFNAVGGMVEILSAPEITRQMYAEFLGVVKQAQKGEIEEPAFIQAASAIDPRLGKIAMLAVKHKGWAATALLVLWLSSCVNLDVKLDANQLIDRVFGGPTVEYVLPDETGSKPEHKLNGDDSNPAKRGSQQKKRDFDPLPTMRKEPLLISASALAIAASLR